MVSYTLINFQGCTVVISPVPSAERDQAVCLNNMPLLPQTLGRLGQTEARLNPLNVHRCVLCLTWIKTIQRICSHSCFKPGAPVGRNATVNIINFSL